MQEFDLWKVEEGFWTGGPEHYRAAMHPECVMVFQPPIGVLSGDLIIRTLEGGPRWASVTMRERHESRPADGAVVLAYLAEGARERSSPYRGYCSSTYMKSDGEWKLVQHQQTPI